MKGLSWNSVFCLQKANTIREMRFYKKAPKNAPSFRKKFATSWKNAVHHLYLEVKLGATESVRAESKDITNFTSSSRSVFCSRQLCASGILLEFFGENPFGFRWILACACVKLNRHFLVEFVVRLWWSNKFARRSDVCRSLPLEVRHSRCFIVGTSPLSRSSRRTHSTNKYLLGLLLCQAGNRRFT